MTGEVAKRLYSAAATREQAREEAASQGLEVTEIVAAHPAAPITAIPVVRTPARTRDTAAAGIVSQFRKELDFATPNTYATFALIALNVLVFGMMCLSGVSAKSPTIDGLMQWGADFGPSTLGGQWWRSLTSSFVHIGFLHLLYNMLALLPAASNLERLVGSRNFVLTYFIAGFGGSLLALYWSPLMVTAGASGAVFGIYGALGGVVLMRGQAMPPALSVALKRSVMAFVLYNAVYSLQPGISLAAHVGGLVSGFVCGLLVANTEPSHEGDVILDRAPPMLVFGLLLAVVGMLGLHFRYPDLPMLGDTFARFDALDIRTSDVVSAAATRFDKKDLSGEQFAQILDRDVLPDWAMTRNQLIGYQPATAGMQGELAAITSYMQVRADSWQLLSAAVRDGAKDKIEIAVRKMREANRIDRDLSRGTRTRIFPVQAKS